MQVPFLQPRFFCARGKGPSTVRPGLRLPGPHHSSDASPRCRACEGAKLAKRVSSAAGTFEYRTPVRSRNSTRTHPRTRSVVRASSPLSPPLCLVACPQSTAWPRGADGRGPQRGAALAARPPLPRLGGRGGAEWARLAPPSDATASAWRTTSALSALRLSCTAAASTSLSSP